MKARQFESNSIGKYNYNGKTYWQFECAMVSACEPVFDSKNDRYHADNYSVEKQLREAKVILSTNKTNTESCALVVMFSSKQSSENFLSRLNKYLREQTPAY